MEISICDDEPQIAGDIASIVSGVFRGARVRTYFSGAALLEGLSQHEADMILLDIDMPERNGLEIAAALGGVRKKRLLVFVTAHDELVYDSLRYHPFAFVRKQYLERELMQVLADCAAEFAAKEERFHFRANGKDIAVLLSNIRYFEAEGNYLVIYSENGENYRVRSTVTMVENTLKEQGFIRIHKGFLVNQAYVKIMGQEDVRLTSGEILPIGKQYAKEAKQQILKYMRE